MRIRCQPFGATAALRAITDERGFVTGSEDWAIDGEAIFQVRIAVAQSIFENLVLSVTSAEASAKANVAGEGIVSLEPFGEAKVATTVKGVDVTFSRVDPESGELTPVVTVDIAVDKQAGKIELFDGEGASLASIAVTAGTAQRRTTGIRTYVAVMGSGGEPELTVATRQPFPPFPRDILDLDAEYEGIIPDGWVVIEYGDDRKPFIGSIEAVSTVSRASYGIVAKVTRLALRDPWLEESDVALETIRNASVFVLGQALQLALQPIDEPVCGDTIRLQRIYPGLQSGRWIVVEGERSDVPGSSGVRTAELAMVAGVSLERQDFGDSIHTVLSLARPLANCYQRTTVVIHGNVAKATHGETREEVLGGGDASMPLQTFALRARPLTYLADASPLGASSTAEFRVDRLRWREARDLVTLSPRDRRFILRTDDTDVTTVTFGTGARGARPTPGQENITVRYRTGTGIAGNVPASKITQLSTRPLGVSAVVNPLPSTGGADRENLEQGRRNLPLGVLALDRLVSVRDYEDFTRARAGIGQASAVALSDGTRRVVHVTIAGTGDAPIDPSSDVFRSLRVAIQEAGDPMLPVTVAVRELILLILAVNVRIADDRLWADMEPVIRARLLDRFGFDRRRLGQAVLVSEVQAGIQEIPGVVYSDVDTLAGVPESITPQDLATLGATIGLPATGRIPARLARYEESTFEVDGVGMTLSDIAGRFSVSLASLVALNPQMAGTPLPIGSTVLVARGVRPAQIALLSRSLRDTLILREIRR
jgi:predicted phage baseplate assembly protein